jgi:hypothetical protein
MSPPLIIRWGFMPPEVRTSVRPMLLQYLWLVPGWCRAIIVDWHQPENRAAQAWSHSRPEYLEGEISFCPNWLGSGETDRRLAVIHEVLHLQLATMQKEHDALIGRMFSDAEAPKFKSTCEEDWRRASEASVQNLAYSILQIPSTMLPTTAFVEEEDEPAAASFLGRPPIPIA